MRVLPNAARGEVRLALEEGEDLRDDVEADELPGAAPAEGHVRRAIRLCHEETAALGLADAADPRAALAQRRLGLPC